MRRMLRNVAEFVGSPQVSLIIGVILIVTAMLEIVEDLDDVGTHHGVALFGVLQVVRALGLLVTREVVEVAEAADRLYDERGRTGEGG